MQGTTRPARSVGSALASLTHGLLVLELSRAGQFSCQAGRADVSFPSGKYRYEPRADWTARSRSAARAGRPSPGSVGGGAAAVGVRFRVEVERGKPTAQLGRVLAVLDALGRTLRIEPPTEC